MIFPALKKKLQIAKRTRSFLLPFPSEDVLLLLLLLLLPLLFLLPGEGDRARKDLLDKES